MERAGGTQNDQGNGISVDNSGNVVVTGEFKGTADFGANSLTSVSNTIDVFTTKLTTAGAFSWVEQGGGDGTNRGIDVSTDDADNVYITGQFSDTIVFDQNHPNQMFNVIFTVKYNSSGDEQWFRLTGNGSSNLPTAIECDGNGNCHVTGDFTGNVSFYGNNTSTLFTTLNSNPYTNKVFIAKYTTSGALSWAEDAGSDNVLTSQSISLDDTGNVYICGSFECQLNEYADQYGDGVFISVGESDIYMAKYDSSGAWQMSRQIGGRADDFGYGISASGDGMAHFTGSFKGTMNVPTSTNFLDTNNWSGGSCFNNNGYCGDPSYGRFHSFTANGSNSDVIIANCFDPSRSTYDFFKREGTGCTRDVVNVCLAPQGSTNCVDSIQGCSGQTIIEAISGICASIGPTEGFQFSGGQFFSNNSRNLFQSGQVTVTHNVGGTFSCIIQSHDTIEAIINDIDPRLTDNKGINTFAAPNNQNLVQQIELCSPDSVQLTINNLSPTDTVNWSGPGISGLNDSVLMVTQDGFYLASSTDTFGCSQEIGINVLFYDTLDSFKLRMNAPDSVEICAGDKFAVNLNDSFGDPNFNFNCFNQYLDPNFIVSWTISPNLSKQVPNFQCPEDIRVTANDTGWFTFSAQVVRYTPCDTDTHFVTKQIYVDTLPKPTFPPINYSLSSPSQYFCPGDSTLLIAESDTDYVWFNGHIGDSLWVSTPGQYGFSISLSDTNQFGCVSTFNGIAQKNFSEKPQPQLNANSLLICPGDSVYLHVFNTGVFFGNGQFIWQTPNGPDTTTTPNLYAFDPGQYSVVVNDTDSCDLASNTITLQQYTTPQLAVVGNPVLCEGDSVTLQVLAAQGSVINWINPPAGDTTSVVVNDSGTYRVNITACNIVTSATVDVFLSEVYTDITSSGSLCQDSFTVLNAKPGLASYQWNTGSTEDSTVITSPGGYVVTTTDTNGCTAVSDSFFVGVNEKVAQITLNGYQVVCPGSAKQLFGTDSMASYLWSPTGDTTQSISVSQAGNYSLVTWDSNGCRTVSQTVELTKPDSFFPTQISGPTEFCEGGFVELTALRTDDDLQTFLWHPTGDSSRSIIVFNSGLYSVQSIDTFGCTAFSDTIEVIAQTADLLEIKAADTTICKGESIDLKANTNVGDLQWYGMNDTTRLNVGETLTTGPLFKTTGYRIWAKNNVCNSDVQTVLVHVKDCDQISIPNVFTPDGDGSNDIWKSNLEEASCFTCEIYNRWGNLVYYYTAQESGWDGTLMGTGEFAEDGVYYYVIKYCTKDAPDESIQHRGHITLIRND